MDYDSFSDEKLLKLFNKGYEEAFHILFHRYEQPLIRYVASFNLAYEEIVQDTFLQLVNKPPRFLLGKSVKSWLFRVARNRCIDVSRQKERQMVSYDVLLDFEDAAVKNPQVESRMADDIKLMKVALDELPEKYREVVSLHIFGELPFKEVAKIMEIPLGTALWRMQKALELLRKQMIAASGGTYEV